MKKFDRPPFCCAVKYTFNKDTFFDYSSLRRPCHNLVFMLAGEGDIISENEHLSVKKGDILYIPQNSTYTSLWKCTPNCEFHSIHFNFSVSQDPFYGKTIPVQIIKNQPFEELYDYVKTIQEYQNSKSLDFFLLLSAFYYLCAKLLFNVKSKKTVLSESSVSPAILYIENNYTKPCTIAHLSKLCFLSPSRFLFLFKKHMGCTPITYKNKITIEKVCQDLVLHKDKSIETIAIEYGFKSTIYFRRLFKKLTGISPSNFRKTKSLI